MPVAGAHCASPRSGSRPEGRGGRRSGEAAPSRCSKPPRATGLTATLTSATCVHGTEMCGYRLALASSWQTGLFSGPPRPQPAAAGSGRCRTIARPLGTAVTERRATWPRWHGPTHSFLAEPPVVPVRCSQLGSNSRRRSPTPRAERESDRFLSHSVQNSAMSARGETPGSVMTTWLGTGQFEFNLAVGGGVLISEERLDYSHRFLSFGTIPKCMHVFIAVPK